MMPLICFSCFNNRSLWSRLHRNNALLLVKSTHMIWNSQSVCFISAYPSYAAFKFGNYISSCSTFQPNFNAKILKGVNAIQLKRKAGIKGNGPLMQFDSKSLGWTSSNEKIKSRNFSGIRVFTIMRSQVQILNTPSKLLRFIVRFCTIFVIVLRRGRKETKRGRIVSI